MCHYINSSGVYVIPFVAWEKNFNWKNCVAKQEKNKDLALLAIGTLLFFLYALSFREQEQIWFTELEK